MRLSELKPGMTFYLEGAQERCVYLVMTPFDGTRMGLWWTNKLDVDAVYDWQLRRHVEEVERVLVVCGHTPETFIRWIKHLKETAGADAT